MSAQNSDDFLKELDDLLQDESGEEGGGAGGRAGTEQEEQPTERAKSGTEALRAALAAHDDVEVLRGLCEGGRVPAELRADVWKECLGVSRRPDAMGSWSGPLDCEHQASIHQQCAQQAAKLGLEPEAEHQVAVEMELVISYYCKSRNATFSPSCGWPELLLPLTSLGLPRPDLFNCFYALVAKYMARDCKENGRPFHLFRLLLLYHDPELCTFLDTHKVAPHSYLQPWLRSMFVSTCSLGVLHVLWDLYLLERDPFLIFFLALVMIINAKDLVMVGGEGVKGDLCATIGALPSHLGPEDVEDFFSLAQYYASRSPQSFRKDYHSTLFGSGRGLASAATNISHALCLPVSLQELLETTYTSASEASGMRYFVVDCRPVEQFSCGHLPLAFNLDANLLLHSPTDFSQAVDRLCQRVKRAGVEGGEHLCFVGSGREQEDQYVHMVVAKFLQKSVPYVSLARGGFLELAAQLGSRVGQILDDYDATRCHAFYSESSYTNSAPSDASDSDSETSSSLYRQKLHERGAKLYAHMAAGFKVRSQRLRGRMSKYWYGQPAKERRHVSQTDRPSRRYRNVHADVFVIADEDEDNEGHSPFSSEDEAGRQMVNVSLYCSNPDVLHSFPCSEINVKDPTDTYQSHLLLTRDSLLVLRELSDRAGWARLKHRSRLDSIIKITAKKKQADVITFKFGMGSGEEAVITHLLRCRIPDTHKCTAAIKTLISKLQPGT